jgi:hypothetical protein
MFEKAMRQFLTPTPPHQHELVPTQVDA